MNRRASGSVNVVGTIMVFYSLLCLFIWRDALEVLLSPDHIFAIMFSVGLGWRIFDGLLYLVAGVFILRLKNWARWLAIISSGLLFLFSIPYILSAIKNISSLSPGNYFVIHPEVFGVNSDTPESLFTIVLISSLIFIPVVMNVFIMIFFIRPKVKEQFKKV